MCFYLKKNVLECPNRYVNSIYQLNIPISKEKRIFLILAYYYIKKVLILLYFNTTH